MNNFHKPVWQVVIPRSWPLCCEGKMSWFWPHHFTRRPNARQQHYEIQDLHSLKYYCGPHLISLFGGPFLEKLQIFTLSNSFVVSFPCPRRWYPHEKPTSMGRKHAEGDVPHIRRPSIYSGQIKSRPHTGADFPQKVAFWKWNGSKKKIREI